MKAQHVPQTHIHFVWPDVKEYIENALNYCGGEYTAEQLKVLLVRGEQHLLVAVDKNNKINGCATVQFIDYPNFRVAFITSIGGRLISTPDTFEELINWCKFNGATKIQGAARESIERLWKKLFKFERRYAIVEKDI
ncbi:MAG: hypothetical protein EBR82_24740 [Caulobacteraceae bacterium]|jgi:hypothetical protein|nr:hypothetical protein [Caulobacteraceae bacterium]